MSDREQRVTCVAQRIDGESMVSIIDKEGRVWAAVRTADGDPIEPWDVLDNGKRTGQRIIAYDMGAALTYLAQFAHVDLS
jgi:hypothetical protein